MKLFEELKRRNVFRMAAVYLAVGWLLTQVAATLEGAIGLPEWFDGMIVALLALGFPLAILFSWAFEITPDGVKRTAEVDQSVSIAPSTGRKLDYILLAAAGLAIAVVVADRLAPRKTQAAAPASPAQALASGDERSIAVLPFVDLSPDGDQEYFADGLSDELLNVLAQSQDLKVAGRTSSFAFKGQGRDLREVGEILNVAHILEGSVRKSGERIRVTAQLIKASDGYRVFSETYDRELSDVFSVQDDIADRIGAALKARLGGETAKDAAPAALKAYDLYLLARQRIYSRNPEQMREADNLLDRALALDPGYAPALAQKAIVTLLLSNASSSYGDDPIAEAAEEAKSLIDRALAVSPDLAEAHAARGLLIINAEGSLSVAEASLQRALEVNPNLSDAQNWLANALGRQGKFSESIAVYEDAVARDPLYRPAFNNLVFTYATNREYEKADALIGRIERIVGEGTGYTLGARGVLALEKGELAESVTRLRAASALALSSNVVTDNYAAALMQLGELEAALEIASVSASVVILHLIGRSAEAAALVESLDAPTGGDPFVLAAALLDHAWTGRYKDAAAYMNRHFASVRGAAEHNLANAPFWTGALALAYRKLGHMEDFAATTALMESALSVARVDGADSGSVYWLPLAELAALREENDLAIERLRTAFEKGYVDANGFHSPVFDSLRGDERFKALEKDMRARANAERAKLGLSPI